MIRRLWFVVQILIVGVVTIEVGVFLQKLDENLSVKLSQPHLYNSSQLLRDVAAYSFNIARLLRLFKLKREQVMETAKCLYSLQQPLFARNLSCEKVKADFQLSERDYKNLLNFMDKINKTLSEFYVACKNNPKFISVPLPKPEYSMDKNDHLLETMFKQPDPSTRPYMILKTAEDYYYTLGKFTKKFLLGRNAVMERAKALFESGGPSFLRFYNFFKIERAYRLSFSESATLDNFIRKIKKRYQQFTRACYKNPNFESKIDFSSVQIISKCESVLNDILSNPSVNKTDLLFKQVRDLYHVLGYLRRYNITHKTELLKAVIEVLGPEGPVIIRSIDFEKIKCDFELEDEKALKLSEYIDHLRRRFKQVQRVFMSLNCSEPMSREGNFSNFESNKVLLNY